MRRQLQELKQVFKAEMTIMTAPAFLTCLTLVVFFGCFHSSVSLASRAGANASHVLKDLLDSTFYDKRLRPNFEGDPVEVSLNVFLTSIGGLDEKEMQFETTFFLRQTWKDSRLAFGDAYKVRNFSISGDIMDQIWKPDTYINNEKSSFAPPKQFLLQLFPDGKVLYSQRMTVLAACMMDLHNYPMDKQRCSIAFESYGMTTHDLILSWASEPYKKSVGVADGVTLSQFALDEYTAEKSLANYTTGSFTILKVTFLIRRKKFYYVVQTYIPTILITILSWVSFWIPRSSPPARVALGITTVLALTTLIFGIQSSMPKVSYVKAIDWFLMISFSFVFAALIEYPSSTFIKFQAEKISKTGTTILRKVKGENVVNSADDLTMNTTSYGHTNHAKELEGDLSEDNAEEKHGFRKTTRFNGVSDVSNPRDYELNDEGLRHRKQKERDMESFKENFTDSEVTNVVDKYARIIFPLSYLLYNVGYWIVYLLEIDLLTRS
ncbi:glycine receptor subunit alpha-2-like isoform X2 [Actinia tenebrosa]|uniref:Gamma-aminobutyric acid receptor subunit beta n=1 Tax=Actinia tenebrosa TaxID=6105 RepID=A0A6P8HV51_ACTTE|nr:glycine receptor subunit alpha-2-like isoform X2 [Actinia tenebrosa]